MKKLVLLFALLFTVSTSFISCRDTEKEADDMDDMEMMDENEMSDDMEDEMEDDMEDMADEMEEEAEEMEDAADDL